MNNDARYDATDKTISLNNESIPETTVFAWATPAPTAGAIIPLPLPPPLSLMQMGRAGQLPRG